MVYLFDACTLIALLNGEDEAEKVTELVTNAFEGKDSVFISSVQALEVYYDRIYIMGREYADTFLDNLFSSPIVIISEITGDLIREAGRFKTSYSMSLADSIMCAIAKNLNATLVTKDNEIKPVENAGEFSVVWLK